MHVFLSITITERKAFCVKITSESSSAGRARPCQGRGREFESRFPLQIVKTAVHYVLRFFCFIPRFPFDLY